VGKLDLWEHQKSGVPAALPCIALPLAPKTAFDTWDAITARTPPLGGRPTRDKDELAMLIYTSGSTGLPKGVMITMQAFSRAGEGITAELERRLGGADNRMLSYLPLAHSFERSWAEGLSLVSGHIHLFFAESLDTFLQDLQRTRPTLFISVPRLWLKFQQGVFAKMPPAKLDRLLRIPVLGKVVAKKIRKGLGLDQVKLAGSGSAPIPPGLIAWYRKIGLPLYEGYGMTEDSSYSHLSNEQHNAPGYVGVPLPGVEVRMSAEGEVLIRSPGQCIGYYKQPELTAESFTEDGYFRTGDLGERTPAGLLKLTGRAKELFKTAKGKYVAPAPIENRINAHPMVELSLVSGVGQPAAYAMVILAEHIRPRLGEDEVRQQVENEMQALLKDINAAVADHEQLHMIVVKREPWSVENGFLTPTMKVRRARIEKSMEAHVDGWYATGRRVHWH
jgi:long-chain acyl-CoA synthetase